MVCTAGDLEHSERDILNLRSQQNRFAERIALMQRLLKVNMVSELICCDSTCFSYVQQPCSTNEPHMRSESWIECRDLIMHQHSSICIVVCCNRRLCETESPLTSRHSGIRQPAQALASTAFL